MRVLRESTEEEMVASFLRGELSSERFGPAIRMQLTSMGEPDELLTRPDLSDPRSNEARAKVLAATRGYREDREIFEFFPTEVRWVKALLAPHELARVRYIEYSYWNEYRAGAVFPQMPLAESGQASRHSAFPITGSSRSRVPSLAASDSHR